LDVLQAAIADRGAERGPAVIDDLLAAKADGRAARDPVAVDFLVTTADRRAERRPPPEAPNSVPPWPKLIKAIVDKSGVDYRRAPAHNFQRAATVDRRIYRRAAGANL
jgi:hypothetical protein